MFTRKRLPLRLRSSGDIGSVRTRVYQRLYDVLTGKNQNPVFARLSTTDRRNILEIVRDTKPGLQMTPEEREKFRQGMGARCGRGPSASTPFA
jgi:hypothetical protein